MYGLFANCADAAAVSRDLSCAIRYTTRNALGRSNADLIHAFESIEATFDSEVVGAVQQYSLLSAQRLANLFRRPFYGADIITQADLIGIGSLPIVMLTGFFTGGVLALQSASTLAQFGAAAITGQLVELLHDQGAGTGADQPDGLRAQRLGYGQRAGFDDGDRAD